jgi:hypothetical protein
MLYRVQLQGTEGKGKETQRLIICNCGRGVMSRP